MAGLKRGKALVEVLEEIENMTVVLLYKKLPIYYKTAEKDLTRQVVDAVRIGIVRYGMMCTNNESNRAAKRVGLNRNTLRMLLKKGELMHLVKTPVRKTTNRSDLSRSRSNSK